MANQRFVVLGAGAWGTALASHLARVGHDVILWGHDPKHIAKLQADHLNAAFLPNVPLPKQLQFDASLDNIFAAATPAIVLIVVPSIAFEETLQKLLPYSKQITGLLWGTKGLSDQGEFLHQLCQRCFNDKPIGILAGPSFAKEVALDLPTAVTIATNNDSFGQTCRAAFHQHYFRVYLSNDLVGAELGGVVKNILAIAVGMCDGLGFGANARAALLTRGLAECRQLGEAIGMQAGTLLSMACLGDIVLTCTDNQSRNRRFGLCLGQGMGIDAAEKEIQYVVEGKKNVAQLMQLAKQYDLDMPICEQVYLVLYEDLAPEKSLQNLLSRAPKRED